MDNTEVQCLLDRTRRALSHDVDYDNQALGVTQAIVLSQHRDSTALDRSNFEVVSSDLQKEFSDDVHVERFNHWAVGWVDYLIVQVVDAAGTPTKAAAAALEWLKGLADYPIADEEAYSKLEYDEAIETIEGVGGQSDSAPEDWASQVFSWLFDTGRPTTPEDLRGKDVEEALQDLGWSRRVEEARSEATFDIEGSRVAARQAAQTGDIPPTVDGINAYLRHAMPGRGDTYSWAERIHSILQYGRPETLEDGISGRDVSWAINELSKRGWVAPGMRSLDGFRHAYSRRR